MEVIFLCLALALLGAAAYLLAQRTRERRQMKQLVRQLDGWLDTMLAGRPLPAPGGTDDDWGRLQERLQRLSRLYRQQGEEITREREELQRLVSDISHQVKTPLSNIRLYGERAAHTGRAAEPDRLIQQVDKLDFLLQSLVKASRLETGAMQIRKRQAPVFATLARAMETVVPKAEQKGIRLSVDGEEGLTLPHDPKWTAEAIFNLLDNAVKYTAPGGSVHVTIRRQEMFTRIAVRDTGKGIALERQGAVFRRFYREPEVHDNEGVGLGLYLARRIVERQEGYLELTSRPGAGSTFTLYLPNEMP